MSKVLGKRGFVTIATGDLRYYILAFNLLKSYRLNGKCDAPFAIISDKENEYTAAFDYVIHFENPSFSFNDKLRLIDYLPFEETIFIDADCLVYDDLNLWWQRFAEADDVCAFGVAHDTLNTGKGWFRASGMHEYSDKISFEPMFNGGVYYIRNTEVSKQVFSIAKEVAKNYKNYAFNGLFATPADEPLLALGMAVCNCRPILNETETQVEYIFAPNPKNLDADILQPKATLKRSDKTVTSRIIHWSNYLTEKSEYKYQIYEMNHHKNSQFIRFAYYFYDVKAVVYRGVRYAKRKWKSR